MLFSLLIGIISCTRYVEEALILFVVSQLLVCIVRTWAIHSGQERVVSRRCYELRTSCDGGHHFPRKKPERVPVTMSYIRVTYPLPGGSKKVLLVLLMIMMILSRKLYRYRFTQ